jgi:hypothetical protein
MSGANLLAQQFQERQIPQAQNVSQQILAYGKKFLDEFDVFKAITG